MKPYPHEWNSYLLRLGEKGESHIDIDMVCKYIKKISNPNQSELRYDLISFMGYIGSLVAFPSINKILW